MKERPILFSGPMVQAILADCKTQTRRVVNAPKCCTVHGRQPMWEEAFVDPGGTIFGPGPYLKLPYGGGDYSEPDEVTTRVRCPYGYPEDGARLWVRETWCSNPWIEHDPQMGPGTPGCLRYRADGERSYSDGWRPSIHMPRWASRITLEITDVRLQRLQSISEEDAVAEGFMPYVHRYWEGFQRINGVRAGMSVGAGQDGKSPAPEWMECPELMAISRTAAEYFHYAWDAIYGQKHPWAENCYVWAVSFKRLEGE